MNWYIIYVEVWQKDKDLPGWIPVVLKSNSREEANNEVKKIILEKYPNVEFKGCIIEEATKEEIDKIEGKSK